MGRCRSIVLAAVSRKVQNGNDDQGQQGRDGNAEDERHSQAIEDGVVKDEEGAPTMAAMPVSAMGCARTAAD